MRYWVVFVSVIGLDQVIKALVQSQMQLGQSIPVIKGLIWLTHVHNQGAAFGLLAGRSALFLIAATVVILGSIFFVMKYRPGAGLETSLALVAGGAAGNLIDRVFLGKVVDFIDIGFWPVFNLADCAIVVGTVWLFWVLLRPGCSERVCP